MQAAASVPVVVSKISMAEAVLVTLTFAVAVRITLSPERGDERSAERLKLSVSALVGPRDFSGTLGITGRGRSGALESRDGDAEVAVACSSQAAGELRSDFMGSAGH